MNATITIKANVFALAYKGKSTEHEALSELKDSINKAIEPFKPDCRLDNVSIEERRTKYGPSNEAGN